jgi:hypothetical protein
MQIGSMSAALPSALLEQNLVPKFLSIGDAAAHLLVQETLARQTRKLERHRSSSTGALLYRRHTARLQKAELTISLPGKLADAIYELRGAK